MGFGVSRRLMSRVLLVPRCIPPSTSEISYQVEINDLTNTIRYGRPGFLTIVHGPPGFFTFTTLPIRAVTVRLPSSPYMSNAGVIFTRPTRTKFFVGLGLLSLSRLPFAGWAYQSITPRLMSIVLLVPRSISPSAYERSCQVKPLYKNFTTLPIQTAVAPPLITSQALTPTSNGHDSSR